MQTLKERADIKVEINEGELSDADQDEELKPCVSVALQPTTEAETSDK